MSREKLYTEVNQLLDKQGAKFNTSDRIYVLKRLLMQGFTWRRSSQGHDYWATIHENLARLTDSFNSAGTTSGNSKESTPSGGSIITAEELMTRVEQLLMDVKATVEASEAESQPNKKAASQWRYALNCLQGATHKRGLLPDLKDAGPGAY